ncbi:aldo/keto reductase [Paenibacillus selenitireducens]|uniref:Aldo/keto reductase n=1 Tax=Paenibacillus selenitireducens TaxID=1324314 RepID=A0A1T2XHZ1_9BACL|nr:aldo/keto reductase [Paenibacillus selenitireducens]OPA79509.1 aldo/keto reductase [Paenibacillus selenitireducens]
MQPTLRTLGASDLRLSPLGLGCWQFSKGEGIVGRFWPDIDPAIIEEIIRVCLEGGINWFDTAEVYGKGQSEQMLASALNKLGVREEDAHIATKWWPALRTAGNIPRTIQTRLDSLKGRMIDLYQIHQPFSFSSVSAEMKQMGQLVKQGKIKYVGVSNFTASKMREADRVLKDMGLRLISNQMKYSMLDRRIEDNEVLDTAKELGISIIAYSPLEQGLLSGKFHRQPELVKSMTGPRKLLPAFKAGGLQRTLPLIELLEQIAVKYNASATQVALNWTIHYHGDTVFAIPGASKVHHAQENVKTMQFRLTDDEMKAIHDVSQRVGR